MDRMLFVVALTMLIASTGVAANQDMVNYLATHLKVEVKVVDNFINTWYNFSGTIYLTNTGDEAVEDSPWSMYFCSVRLMEPNVIRPAGAPLGTSGLMVYHENGCLHKIAPDAAVFRGLQPGQRLEVPFFASDWMISRSDAMPNWYVTAEGAEPRTLASTSGEEMTFVHDFASANQWKRQSYDLYDPYTPEVRLGMQDYRDLGEAPVSVLPTPVYTSLDTDDRLTLTDGDWVVVSGDGSLSSEATYIAGKLNTVVLGEDSAPTNRYVRLLLGEIILEGQPITTAEAYHVHIDATTEIITITGKDASGVFYGIQSLLSLKNDPRGIPAGDVTDYPRYQHRGMHVDVSRNFHSKDAIEKIMEAMSMYKLNKFHFHLTDDEGWRLEIPGLPELTEVGSNRCHDESGDQCILPQLGSNPGPGNGGSGYYSVEDYKAILQFATERHIEVIPEFDSPGHAHAAINAMLARYRKYQSTDMPRAQEYLLSDPDDESEYLSIQYFTDNAINPCLNSTYTFMDHVMREVVQLHAAIQPLTAFHFGGDEVPHGAWIDSPACASLMADRGYNNSEHLKEHFVRQVAGLAHASDLDLAGWEDGLWRDDQPYDMTSLPADTTYYSYVWNTVWEWGTGERAYRLANEGYKVILSPATHLYFDHPQEPDPEERGFYWATRIAPIRKAFSYSPDHLYDNIGVDRFGNTLDKENICSDYGCPPLESDKAENILGIQGQLWSETVRTDDQLEYMIFPRLLALAERAWHKASWENIENEADRDSERTKDWEQFANVLGYKELGRLDAMSVAYRVPPPGARVHDDNRLEAMPEFPGLVVEFSLDGGATWRDYTANYELSGDKEVLLRSRSADNSRTSRQVALRGHPMTSASGRPGGFPQGTMLFYGVFICLAAIVKRHV